MSGDDCLDVYPSDSGLAAALRALPESAPQPDLWPELARALDTRRTRRRQHVALPIAIAAALAVAVLLPKMTRRENDVPGVASTMHAGPTTTSGADAAPIAANVPPSISNPTATASEHIDQTDEIARLHQRSRTLERWIAAVAERAPQDGRDLMAAVEVEDLIGLVDVQLGGARENVDALPLWRQRVALLQDLATIRGNAFALAENDTGARVAPAAVNQLN